MAHRKRARNNGARAKTWFLGACVMSAAAQGALAFAVSSYSFRQQANPASRGGFVLAQQAVAPTRRAENQLSMKMKNAGKKPAVRSRRGGPPANVEGYSQAAFGQCGKGLYSPLRRRRFCKRRQTSMHMSGISALGATNLPVSVLSYSTASIVMLVLALVLKTAADDHPIDVVEEKCCSSQVGPRG